VVENLSHQAEAVGEILSHHATWPPLAVSAKSTFGLTLKSSTGTEQNVCGVREALRWRTAMGSSLALRQSRGTATSMMHEADDVFLWTDYASKCAKDL
jgi:hypothetical protein